MSRLIATAKEAVGMVALISVYFLLLAVPIEVVGYALGMDLLVWTLLWALAVAVWQAARLSLGAKELQNKIPAHLR